MIKISKKLARRTVLVATFAFSGCVVLWESPDDTIKRRASLFEEMYEESVANMADPLKETDTPVYFQIPKSGSSPIEAYYGCMGLTLATRTGIDDGHDQDETLQVWERSSKGKFVNGKFVNVDTMHMEGIFRAKELGLAESGLADVVFSPSPPVASILFDLEHQARFFALFQHPIERAISTFYYHQIARWEENEKLLQPELVDVTIEEWLKKFNWRDPEVGNFYMRLLLNKHSFTDEDLEKAKNITRTKFLVGLESKMEESVERFDKYFGWYGNEKRPECQQYAMQKAISRNPLNNVKKGSKVWNLLAELNYYDLQLYKFIVQLYEEQREFLGPSRTGEAAL